MSGIALRLGTVCLDCHDAHAMAAFYGRLLGWEPMAVEADWVLMRDPGGGAGLSFQAEPAYAAPTWPKTAGEQQKMIHLDVQVTGPDGAHLDDPDERAQALADAVTAALDAGGTLAPHQPHEDLRVVLDPAGHPLCLFLD